MINDIFQAIQAVGFPICSFFVMAYGLKYSFDAMTKQTEDSMEKIGNLTEAVNNNTVALTKLAERVAENEGGISIEKVG